jgi:urease accessory protein
MGMESAIAAGLVRDHDDVVRFCRGRLQTSGRVAAGFAAAACDLWNSGGDGWTALDAEFDARTPSPALRAASRQLGRGLTRLARSTLPGFAVPAEHHPVVLGAAVAAAGGDRELAARAAALSTVSVPASAALRLLGLDPFAVQALLADLAREIDRTPVPDGLPADAAPALDLLADHHLTTEVRLFAS